MGKFRVKLKLTGLEIEVEGDREHAHEIAQNVGKQLAQVIQPVAMIEASKNLREPMIIDAADASSNGARHSTRRKRTTTSSGGGADGSAVTWTHDPNRWGTPRQEWKSVQKIAWLLFVLQEAKGQAQQLGTGILANTFNDMFTSAGVVHQGNLARDLKREPDLFGEMRGKWFLKDKGRQFATDKLLPEALGKVPVANVE